MHAAAVDALEVEQQGKRLFSLSQYRDLSFGECRQFRAGTSAVVGGIGQSACLDESEYRRREHPGGEPYEPSSGSSFPVPGSGQDDHSHGAADDVQQRAVLAETVQHKELQSAEPQRHADEAAAQQRQQPPDQAVERPGLGAFAAEEQQADEDQEIDRHGRQADRHPAEHIGPGAVHDLIAPAAWSATCQLPAGQGMIQHPSGEQQGGCTQRQHPGFEPAQGHVRINTGWLHPVSGGPWRQASRPHGQR